MTIGWRDTWQQERMERCSPALCRLFARFSRLAINVADLSNTGYLITGIWWNRCLALLFESSYPMACCGRECAIMQKFAVNVTVYLTQKWSAVWRTLVNCVTLPVVSDFIAAGHCIAEIYSGVSACQITVGWSRGWLVVFRREEWVCICRYFVDHARYQIVCQRLSQPFSRHDDHDTPYAPMNTDAIASSVRLFNAEREKIRKTASLAQIPDVEKYEVTGDSITALITHFTSALCWFCTIPWFIRR